jgi:Ca2+-binding RTX toxin-like protein
VILGGAGSDILIGGSGDDHLTSEGGGDFFVFRSGFGHDMVADFNVGDSLHHDVLDLRGLGFASIQAVLDATDSGSNAMIHVGSDDITLLSVSKAMLAANTSTILL